MQSNTFTNILICHLFSLKFSYYPILVIVRPTRVVITNFLTIKEINNFPAAQATALCSLLFLKIYETRLFLAYKYKNQKLLIIYLFLHRQK